MANHAELTRDELIVRNEALQAQCDQLIYILRHVIPEQSGAFFVSSAGGERDENNLPEAIWVCPAFGANFSVLYRREGPRSERVAFEAKDAASLKFDVPPLSTDDGSTKDRQGDGE